jgi:hypothetical protein
VNHYYFNWNYLAHNDDCFQRTAKEKIMLLTNKKYILMDELNYSAPSSSSQIEQMSAEVGLHATESELQNAESSGVESLHSVQHNSKAGRKITVSV